MPFRPVDELVDCSPDRLLSLTQIGAQADIRKVCALLLSLERSSPDHRGHSRRPCVRTERRCGRLCPSADARGAAAAGLGDARAADDARRRALAGAPCRTRPASLAPAGRWRVPASGAAKVVSALRREGLLERAEPDRRIVPFTHLSAGDPLIPNEWWIHDIGDDLSEPPPPGVPVTVIDTGLDLSHPEFSARPNTIALNAQTVVSMEDVHGTAVSSVVGAPSNGLGIVGIYPQAVLQEWDFGDGSLSEILAGLDAASKRGRGVVNFSGGFVGYSGLLEQGIDRALHRGTVVVAAVGTTGSSAAAASFPRACPTS